MIPLLAILTLAFMKFGASADPDPTDPAFIVFAGLTCGANPVDNTTDQTQILLSQQIPFMNDPEKMYCGDKFTDNCIDPGAERFTSKGEIGRAHV